MTPPGYEHQGRELCRNDGTRVSVSGSKSLDPHYCIMISLLYETVVMEHVGQAVVEEVFRPLRKSNAKIVKVLHYILSYLH